jgi:hypothetical protein
VKTFKLSRDPKFLEKMTDVIGLYLNPPQQAIVLCVDEKSQIQALDRTQPGLPIKKGRCGTMTHDYKRNGTTTLFAALEVLQGKVIGQCHQRHRHQEFLKFLRALDQEFPGEVSLHLVMDNYLFRGHCPAGSLFDPSGRTNARLGSANWNSWGQSGAQSEGDASANSAHSRACEFHSGLTHALTLGHRAATPMRHAFGLGLQGCIHNGSDLVRVVVRFASAPRGNLPYSVQALFEEALAPQDDGLAVDGQLPSDGYVGLPVRSGQHDSAAQGDLLRGAVGRRPLLDLLPFGN